MKDKEMSTIDLLKRTFGVWKGAWANWLLPPLETYVLSMILGLGIGVVIVMAYFLLFALFFGLTLVTGDVLIATIPVVIIGSIVYLGLMVISMLFGGVISGGLHKVISKNLLGQKYEFFDVLRSGWSRKGVYFGITFINGLVMFIIEFILLLPLIGVDIVGIVLMGWSSSPLLMMASMLLLQIFLIIDIVIVTFFMMALAPTLQTPFIASVYQDLPAGASFSRGMGLVMSHKGTFFKLGLLYAAVMLVASMVPMVGILVQLFVPTYLNTTLQMYSMDNGLAPKTPRPSRRRRQPTK